MFRTGECSLIIGMGGEGQWGGCLDGGWVMGCSDWGCGGYISTPGRIRNQNEKRPLDAQDAG